MFDCGTFSNQVLATIGQAFVFAGQEVEVPDEYRDLPVEDEEEYDEEYYDDDEMMEEAYGGAYRDRNMPYGASYDAIGMNEAQYEAVGPGSMAGYQDFNGSIGAYQQIDEHGGERIYEELPFQVKRKE